MRKMLENAINNAIENGADIQWAADYVEPGYTAGDDGVFFANWNTSHERDPVTGYYDGAVVHTVESRIGALLERAETVGHFDGTLEWSDEWTTCDECGRAVRTQPDSYSWTPSYKLIDECSIVCQECILDDPDAYEQELVNNPDKADTFGVDWSAHGWRRLAECETGWHLGQDDSPQDVYARLSPLGDVLFTIDSVGQFDAQWSAWVRAEEWETVA